VAEDHEVSQRVMRRALEALGYEVDVAATGHAAVEAAVRTRYDLVLMDCQMPGMDGFEAAARLREQAGAARTPIVAITASAAAADREAARLAGMNDFLNKPVLSEDLERLLVRWIGREARGSTAVAPVASAEPASRESESPLDPRVIAELRTLSAGNFLAESIDLFVKSADRSLEGLRAAVRTGDGTSAARRAHSLRGSCAIIGARVMMDLAGRAEESARRGSHEDAASLLAALEREYGRVKNALEAERVAPR